MGISLCIIVKDEEDKLNYLLKSVSDCFEEILIIDNGSKKPISTLKTSSKCKIINESKLKLDQSRNLFFEYAKSEWILTLDVDEIIFSEDIKKIKDSITNLETNVTAIYLPRYNYFGNGRWATTYICKMYRNSKKVQYHSAIHGSVFSSVKKIGGDFGVVDIPIHHFDGLIGDVRADKRERNIELLLKKIKDNNYDASTYNYLSLEYFAEGDYAKAIDTVTKGVELDVGNETVGRLFRAQMYFGIGDFEKSKMNAQQFISNCKNLIKKGDKRTVLYLRRINNAQTVLVNCFLKTNENEKALEEYKKMLKGKPYLCEDYINMYFLDGMKDSRFIGQAFSSNPLIAEKLLYRDVQKGNIHILQDSLLNCVDMKKIYSELEDNKK